MDAQGKEDGETKKNEKREKRLVDMPHIPVHDPNLGVSKPNIKHVVPFLLNQILDGTIPSLKSTLTLNQTQTWTNKHECFTLHAILEEIGNEAAAEDNKREK